MNHLAGSDWSETTSVAARYFCKEMRYMKLTKSETAILDYYRSLNEERFCRSLKTIAKATGVNERSVRRANERFAKMGILSWIRGHGGQGNIGPETPCMPNQYRFDLQRLKMST
jgi:hypothetical protein